MLGFSLLSAFLLISWLIVCGTGFVLGFLFRRIFRRPESKLADNGLDVGELPIDYGREPHSWAAWRSALVILIGAVAAIAGMTYLSTL